MKSGSACGKQLSITFRYIFSLKTYISGSGSEKHFSYYFSLQFVIKNKQIGLWLWKQFSITFQQDYNKINKIWLWLWKAIFYYRLIHLSNFQMYIRHWIWNQLFLLIFLINLCFYRKPIDFLYKFWFFIENLLIFLISFGFLIENLMIFLINFVFW